MASGTGETSEASPTSAGAPSVVFILDCDNTLLDNDAVKADYDRGLHTLLGEALTERFWVVYEDVRAETGTVDFPLTLSRFRPLCPDAALFERLTALIMDEPFAHHLYPDTLDTLRYLREIGMPAIVSDGDQTYQPLKIARSGLLAAVEGRMLIYIHKEDHLPTIFRQWPAPVYVMVDDKARILSAIKARFPHRFATVHVHQGHYGMEPISTNPPPDLSIAGIGDLRHFGIPDFTRFVSGG